MSAEQQRVRKMHREAVILAETEKLLGFSALLAISSSAGASPVSSSAAVSSEARIGAGIGNSEEEAAARTILDAYGISASAIRAYLLRYLRSKHLSVKDAVAKLRRRRAFEHTLPTISVTPVTVATLRSGAFHLLDYDLEGRPVLYIDVKAFTLPTLEADEAERLLVILLEFMQAQCVLKNNEDEAARRRQSCSFKDEEPTTRGDANGNTVRNGAAVPLSHAQEIQAKEKEVTGHVQQFTLLINEESAPWVTHEAFLRNCSTFFTVVPKYYPQILGPTLVLGASFEIRMAVKACVGTSPSEVRNSVQMIERADLERFFSLGAIPAELGGQKQLGNSAMRFSEAVLRNWFTLTSQMEEERVSGEAVDADVGKSAAVFQRAMSTSPSAAGGDGTPAAELADRQRSALTAASAQLLRRPLYMPPLPLGRTLQHFSCQRRTLELERLCSGAASTAERRHEASTLVYRAKSDEDALPRDGKAAAFSPDGGQIISPTAISLGSTRALKDASVSAFASGRLRHTEAADDDVCSALSETEYREFDNEKENGDDMQYSPSSPGLPGTHQLFTAASSFAGSANCELSVHHRGGSGVDFWHRSFGGVPLSGGAAASPKREDAAYFAEHPEDAVAALRQERQRRRRAEQALQFRDLGVTLDFQNASIIEKELAVLHQDLNVLVAEVLVKSEAATKRQKTPPTLNQLLDLTLTAFNNATRTPSTVPAMSLAKPLQRAPVSSSCCSFM